MGAVPLIGRHLILVLLLLVTLGAKSRLHDWSCHPIPVVEHVLQLDLLHIQSGTIAGKKMSLEGASIHVCRLLLKETHLGFVVEEALIKKVGLAKQRETKKDLNFKMYL